MVLFAKESLATDKIVVLLKYPVPNTSANIKLGSQGNYIHWKQFLKILRKLLMDTDIPQTGSWYPIHSLEGIPPEPTHVLVNYAS